MNKNRSRFLLKILTVAILGIVAFFIYKTYFFRSYKNIPWIFNGHSKSYTNSDPYYSIRYPNNWKIDSSDANLTSEKQGAILSISNGDVEFQVIAHSVDSSPSKHPRICQYTDSNYSGNLTISGNYYEIKSRDIVYRTTDTLPFVGGSVDSGYKTICFKKSNEEKFTDILGQINITYNTTKGFDDEEIEIMNQMLTTFQFR